MKIFMLIYLGQQLVGAHADVPMNIRECVEFARVNHDAIVHSTAVVKRIPHDALRIVCEVR